MIGFALPEVAHVLVDDYRRCITPPAAVYAAVVSALSSRFTTTIPNALWGEMDIDQRDDRRLRLWMPRGVVDVVQVRAELDVQDTAGSLALWRLVAVNRDGTAHLLDVLPFGRVNGFYWQVGSPRGVTECVPSLLGVDYDEARNAPDPGAEIERRKRIRIADAANTLYDTLARLVEGFRRV